MSDERPPSVLGGLPRSRPHRRSDKRPAVPLAAAETDAPEASLGASAVAPEARSAVAPKARGPGAPEARSVGAPKASSAGAPEARSAGAPEARSASAPKAAAADPGASAVDTGPLGTAVQAAAEIAEIGLKAGARALRGALSRLPRP